jgi:phytoene synthase
MDDIETTPPPISAAYEACRRLQRRHDPTYYWATRRLPAELQPATHALYGYVRTADEIVDGPNRPPTPEARRAALDAWERELRRGLAGDAAPHPVVGALIDAGERHALPLDELGTYMRSMRVDCGPVRIGSDAELDAYMDGSAGSVGRIMARLLDVPERFHADFGRLGEAFQLANFIRDVRKDWELDRIYMPGLQDEDVQANTPALRSIVAQQVARARALFAAAEPAIAAAPASVRSGIRLACAAYARILDRAEAAGGDVLGRRIGVRMRDLPAIVAAGRR